MATYVRRVLAIYNESSGVITTSKPDDVEIEDAEVEDVFSNVHPDGTTSLKPIKDLPIGYLIDCLK